MESDVEFLPAIPLPVPFDVQKRIQQLRSYLDPKDPNYQPKNQHINIRAAIKLYEEKKIDGTEQVCIKNGKIVTEEETFEGPTPSLVEGVSHQFYQKYSYGHGPFGNNHHEIRMLLRLIPALGGDGRVIGIIVMNDTGSDMLTLFDIDVPLLGNTQGYGG